MQPPRRLYAMTGLTDAGSMLTVFTITRILADRDVAMIYIGLLGAAYMLGASVATMVTGFMSDRLGRRSMMALAMLMALMGTVGCFLWMDRTWLLTSCYILTGTGAGGVYPPLMAWLTRNGTTKTVKSISNVTRRLFLFCLSWNLGIAFGQAGGGAIYDGLGRQGPLLAAILLFLCNLLLLLTLRGPSGGDTKPVKQVDRENSMDFARLCWVANVGGTFSMSVIFHLFPLLAVDMKLPAGRQGLLVGLTRLLVVGIYLVMHWTQFWRRKFWVAVVAHISGIAGLGVITMTASEPGLMLGLAGLAVLVGYNYFASLYYSTTGSSNAKRGFALGIHEATLLLGAASGAAFGGIAGTALASVRIPYILAAMVVATMLTIQIALYRRSMTVDRDSSGLE